MTARCTTKVTVNSADDPQICAALAGRSGRARAEFYREAARLMLAQLSGNGRRINHPHPDRVARRRRFGEEGKPATDLSGRVPEAMLEALAELDGKMLAS